MGVAYPRRDDAVYYEEFDGSLESAQRVANLTGLKVNIALLPADGYRLGDTVRIKELSFGAPTNIVTAEDVVVATGRLNKSLRITVMDRWTFAEKFSKDGS
ncbi:hypothetical protein [Mycolicibacterium sphagni]|uniref:Uncharacterized protein n=1 Tax=Mycolicibacterium sphagni TaxID=1786 RepID=A0A255DXB0_9MYCO|nr:hypothetical protein [Mycolicibacterium sphagni]OYN81722.1 hypothetical protein CG716_05035 [Mycolicibacterium sphagni]